VVSYGCYGCYGGYGGSCYGGGCYGCYGGAVSYGCYGGAVSYGCSGSFGGYGCAGFGDSYGGYGCYGCSGGGVIIGSHQGGTHHPMVVSGHQSTGVYAVAPKLPVQTMIAQRAQTPVVTPLANLDKAGAREVVKQSPKKSENGGNNESLVSHATTNEKVAEIVVHLPADAKLYVDNVHCPLTSAKRTFKTPELEPGKKYFYILRAEVVENGQTVSESLRVFLTPGQQVQAEFTKWTPATRTVSAAR
jgi:uncharacterized protein (TIGR03000 family)